MKLKRRLENATRLHETNYSKLVLVIPTLREIKSVLHLSGNGNTLLEVRILEKSKFTTTLELRLRQAGKSHWLPSLEMKIRTYHDARVAEVLAFQGHHRLHPRYIYPNPQMYHRDEKWQQNNFLGDWLDHCLHSRCIFRDLAQTPDTESALDSSPEGD